jgi:HSP20 family protein
MSNIVRTTPTTSLLGFDPFRTMREMARWEPFRDLAAMPMIEADGFNPSFDMKETKEGFVLKADMPGVKESDIEVSLTGNRLSISGKREAEEKKQGEDYYSIERTFGSFTRAFTLPDGVDAEKANAELKNGVFTMTLPKAPGGRSKQIQVKAK